MNSPIKLPPLPEPRIVSYQVDSILLYTELRTYDDADMRAYAEQAVRAALASAPVADETALQAWADRFPEISDMGRLRDAWNEARASAPVAGEAVYTLRVRGAIQAWTPTVAAFSIPDGEHQLFLSPAAPQASAPPKENNHAEGADK